MSPAEQLDDETVPRVAWMLSEIIEGLEAEFDEDEVVEAVKKDAQSS